MRPMPAPQRMIALPSPRERTGPTSGGAAHDVGRALLNAFRAIEAANPQRLSGVFGKRLVDRQGADARRDSQEPHRALFAAGL